MSVCVGVVLGAAMLWWIVPSVLACVVVVVVIAVEVAVLSSRSVEALRPRTGTAGGVRCV